MFDSRKMFTKTVNLSYNFQQFLYGIFGSKIQIFEE